MNKSIWGNMKGLPEKGNKTIGREGEAGGNDDDNRVYLACKTKGMRHLGGTARAATRAGGVAWVGGICYALGPILLARVSDVLIFCLI